MRGWGCDTALILGETYVGGEGVFLGFLLLAVSAPASDGVVGPQAASTGVPNAQGGEDTFWRSEVDLVTVAPAGGGIVGAD